MTDSELMTLLDRAKGHLLDARPEQASALIEEFLDRVGDEPCEADDLRLCRGRLRDIRRLAEAACRGIADARGELRRIALDTRRLQTYDRAGKLTDRAARAGYKKSY